MNGAYILSRPGNIIKKIMDEYKENGGFILHTEKDEPNYCSFYDIYGDKHEIIVEVVL